MLRVSFTRFDNIGYLILNRVKNTFSGSNRIENNTIITMFKSGSLLFNISKAGHKNKLLTCDVRPTAFVPTLVNSPAVNIRLLSTTLVSKMRLVQFTIPGLEGQNIGILNNDQVINLNTADPELPRTILEVLRKGLLKKCQE